VSTADLAYDFVFELVPISWGARASISHFKEKSQSRIVLVCSRARLPLRGQKKKTLPRRGIPTSPVSGVWRGGLQEYRPRRSRHCSGRAFFGDSPQASGREPKAQKGGKKKLTRHSVIVTPLRSFEASDTSGRKGAAGRQ